jgi:hypothetical protein
LPYDLQFVRQYQLANNADILIGEFSAAREDVGGSEYCNELISLCESYGWDWTYQAFDSGSTTTTGAGDGYADTWDPEQGMDPNNPTHFTMATTNCITDRQKLLTSWFTNDAQPVGNFSFESPSLTPGSIQSAPTNDPSWKYANTMCGIISDGSTWGNPAAPTGYQAGYLESYNGTLGLVSQTVNWTNNTTYTVTLTGAQDGGAYGSQPVNIFVGGSISNGILSGATLVGTMPAGGTAWTSYTTPPFTVGTTPESRLLTLQAGNSTTGLHVVFIDNVQVSGTPLMVRNAGFEFASPTLAPNSYVNVNTNTFAQDFTDWAFTTGAGISTNNTKWTGYSNMIPAGSQMAFLTPGSSITNTTIGTWDTTATYQIWFLAGQSTGNGSGGSSSLNFYLNYGGSTQKSIGSITPGGNGTVLYWYPTSTFNVSGVSLPISFTFLANGTGAASVTDAAIIVVTPKVP